LAAKTSLLGTEKDRPMIFYCKHGVRAGMATGFAQRNGFFNAFAMTDAVAVRSLLSTFSDKKIE
jgi:phage shock protein E